MLMLSSSNDIPLSLLVLRFTCGCYSDTWCSNHLIVDGYSLSLMACSWADLVGTKKIARALSFCCSLFLPHSLEKFNPTVDPEYTTITPDDLINTLMGELHLRGVYYVTAPEIEQLCTLTSRSGCRATRTEAFTAHVWKLLAEVVGDSDLACRMGCFVNSRPRLLGRGLESYVGNGHSVVVKDAGVEALRESELHVVAEMVGDAICEVGNEDHFLHLVNWVERHERDFMIHKKCLGLGLLGCSSRHAAPCGWIPTLGLGRR